MIYKHYLIRETMLNSANLENIFPMTAMQQGMFFEYLRDKDSVQNVEWSNYKFHGKLDPVAIEKAVNNVISRHQGLRVIFIQKQAQLLQVVLKNATADFRYFDLSVKSGGSFPDELMRIQKIPFDLSREIAMRIALFKLGEGEYQLVWIHHHILMDGWCMSIILNEFIESYAAIRQNITPALPKAPQLQSYVGWLSTQDHSTAKKFWSSYLKDLPGATFLLANNARKNTSEKAEYESFVLDTQTALELTKVARQLNVTLNLVFQAIWGVLVSKVTGKHDVTFGAVVSGRPPDVDGIERMVSLFMNTVPVRIRISPSMTFSELLSNIKSDFISGLQSQHLSLAEIQASAGSSGRALFDNILIFQNFPIDSTAKSTCNSLGIEVHSERTESQSAYALNVRIVVVGNDIRIEFVYDKDAVDKSFIQLMQHYLHELAGILVSTPQQLITKIELLKRSKEELKTSDSKNSQPRTVPSLILQQVQKHPESIAVISGDRCLSYKELWLQSDRLAGYLLTKWQLKPGSLVGILMNKSENVIICMLGIMKARCGYVPLDATYPQERLAFMANDSSLSGIITESEFMFQTDFFSGNFLVVDLEMKHEKWKGFETQLPLKTTEEDIAYVIYTSGSTARPKGVMIEHRQICNTLNWRLSYYHFNSKMVGLQIPSISFDSSVEDIFCTLTTGGTLVISHQEHTDVSSYVTQIETHKISHLLLVPTLYDVLIDALANRGKSLEFIVLAGEALPLKLAHKHFQQFDKVRLFNEYGPTECAVCATVCEIRDSDFNIGIGTPISGTSIHVLDKELNPTPAGDIGEIFISGNGVGRGYLNNPDLTAERYVFHPVTGTRMYKTGDLGRYRLAGDLEFLGREDTQVKINGRRVELTEIENEMMSHPDIKTSVVIYDQTNANKRLIAYYESVAGEVVADIQQFLHLRLPGFMVPRHYVQVSSFTRTINGKIDRKNLPAFIDPGNQNFTKSNDRTITRLKEMFEDILGQKGVGIDDDFFSLGGHSISAIKLVAKIQKEWSAHISINDIFNNPTVRKLSPLVSDGSIAGYLQLHPIEEQYYYELSHAQKRLWVLNEVLPDRSVYNMTSFTELNGQLNLEFVKETIAFLLARHESLRTVFVKINGEPRQKIELYIEPSSVLEIFDLPDESLSPELLQELLREKSAIEFDLRNGPLFYLFVLQSRHTSILGFVIHHIISDGWSNDILSDQFLNYYKSKLDGRAVEEITPRVQYKDYSAWQNHLLKLDSENLASYWGRKLSGQFPRLFARSAGSESVGKRYRGLNQRFAFPAGLRDVVTEFCKSHSITQFVFYITCVKLLLFKFTRQNIITVGAPVAGRDHSDLQDQVGLYLNYLVLKDEVSADDSAAEITRRIQQTVMEALEHQHYPYDRMVEDVWRDTDRDRNPLYDVLVVMPTEPREREENTLFANRSIDIETSTNKVDLIFFFNQDINGAASIGYNSDLFSPGEISEVFTSLLFIVQAVVENQNARISDLLDREPLSRPIESTISASQYLTDDF